MDIKDFENIDEIEVSLQEELKNVEELTKELNIICNSAKEFKDNQVSTLVQKANYRMGNLENAIKYSDVANAEEVDVNKKELTSIIQTLLNEKNTLDAIRIELTSQTFNIEKYQGIVEKLADKISYGVKLAADTIDKGNLMLDGKVTSIDDSLDEEDKNVEETQEQILEAKKAGEEIVNINNETENIENSLESPIEDIKLDTIEEESVSTEVPIEEKVEETKEVVETPDLKTEEVQEENMEDSLDRLMSELNQEMAINEDNITDLKETQNNINEEVKVVDVIDAPKEMRESVFTPIEEQSLGDILNGENPLENISVENNAPAQEVTTQNVDEEPVKVVNIEEFFKENTLEDNKELSRTR